MNGFTLVREANACIDWNETKLALDELGRIIAAQELDLAVMEGFDISFVFF